MADLTPIPGRAYCRASVFPQLAQLDEDEEAAVLARMAELGHDTRDSAQWDVDVAFDALEYVRPRIIRGMRRGPRYLSGW